MDDVWSDPQAITGESSNQFSHTKLCVMSSQSLVRAKEWEENGTGKIAHRPATTFLLLSWVAEYFHQWG